MLYLFLYLSVPPNPSLGLLNSFLELPCKPLGSPAAGGAEGSLSKTVALIYRNPAPALRFLLDFVVVAYPIRL
jgi:hypothetical protein